MVDWLYIQEEREQKSDKLRKQRYIYKSRAKKGLERTEKPESIA